MSLLEKVSNPQLRSEFMRAADLAEQVQLTLFRHSPSPSRDDIVARFVSACQQLEVSEAALAQNRSTLDEHHASIMREVLSDVMDGFNDPFANYIPPQSLIKYYQRRGGHFVGIGIKYRARDGAYPVIIGPLTGGPLEHSDIQPGDRLREIDGIDQFAAQSKDISQRLRGKAGSSVRLLLSRANQSDDISVLAQRQKVALEYARAEMRQAKIGSIRISRFGGKTHLLVRKLLRQLIEAGARGIVLDLRDNPGGSTLAARAIVSLFSQQASVYAEQFKSGKTRLLPRHGESLTGLPLAVLVNERSMSSSEIVAGALQTSGRAVVVGAPTYGKGLIQRVFDLKPPLGGALRATIAAYATLDDVLIHGVGIVPDYFVSGADASLPLSETGSLNISPAARRFKRELLVADIQRQHPPDEAVRLIGQADLQLAQAMSVLQN